MTIPSSQHRPEIYSPLVSILNHVSLAAVNSALTGTLGLGIGYLCSRIIKPIDPRTAFVCGAAVGAVYILFQNEKSSIQSKVVGLAILAFAPFKICHRLEFPATFKMTVLLTTTVIAITRLAIFLQTTRSQKKKDKPII